MEWLPSEFSGVRSVAEAEHDLLAIAGGLGGRNEAHVEIDPDSGPVRTQTGYVTAEVQAPGGLTIRLDGETVFDFDAGEFRGAWLSCNDGGQYYGLSIDLGWGCVGLSDAYNGL